jgi:predicted acetyltransferase
MRIINLKKEEAYIKEYISLRNRYSEFLLTKPVNVKETKEWLKGSDVETRGIVQDAILLGVAILYLNRGGEIAFFAKDRHQGIGTKLLKIIERVAKEKNLKSVWAWVLSDNLYAPRTFQKNGYLMEGESSRSYEGESKTGFIFRKKILRDGDNEKG